MPLAPQAPGGWYPEPQNPGSVVDATPSYGGGPAGSAGAQDWGSNAQGWSTPADGYGNAGYGNQGYGGGYGSQAYGGTQGTYAPPYGQQGQYGGYAPSYGYAGYAVPQYELADRGMRLLAAIIDSIVVYVPAIGLIVLGVAMGKEAPVVAVLGVAAGALYALGIVIAQIVMLCQRGQTIGKRVLGIRIVKVDTGQNGGGVTNVILRSLVPGLIGWIPYIGPLFGLINVCFIFAQDRRCIHDHIAGTVVVTGDP
jgi:uncharacterized RDD family membrane protein YckC